MSPEPPGAEKFPATVSTTALRPQGATGKGEEGPSGREGTMRGGKNNNKSGQLSSPTSDFKGLPFQES